MFSGLLGLSMYFCLTGLDTGAIFLLDDTGSQAAEPQKWISLGLMIKISMVKFTSVDIIKRLFNTIWVKDSGLHKRRLNHFKPPEKLSHKHQVVTLQSNTHRHKKPLLLMLFSTTLVPLQLPLPVVRMSSDSIKNFLQFTQVMACQLLGNRLGSVCVSV